MIAVFKHRLFQRFAPRRADPSIPTITNLALAGLHCGIGLFQCFVLPIYLLPKSPVWGFVLVPLALMTTPLWALLHEAIHDVFNASRRVNRCAGRLLAVSFGSPFHVLQLTHLSHHKFNRARTEKGTEIYDSQKVSRLRASVYYFFYVFCGLYWVEVSSIVLFFLPPRAFGRMRRRLLDRGNPQEKWLAGKFMDETIVRQTRIDGLAICLILSSSAFCFGRHWLMFTALLMARTLLVSLHDNVYHYGTSVGVTVSGHNLFIPKFFATLVLNFNLHRIHHRHPNVPWIKLPDYFARQSETYDRNFLIALVQQLRGPIPISNAPTRFELPDQASPTVLP